MFMAVYTTAITIRAQFHLPLNSEAHILHRQAEYLRFQPGVSTASTKPLIPEPPFPAHLHHHLDPFPVLYHPFPSKHCFELFPPALEVMRLAHLLGGYQPCCLFAVSKFWAESRGMLWYLDNPRIYSEVLGVGRDFGLKEKQMRVTFSA